MQLRFGVVTLLVLIMGSLPSAVGKLAYWKDQRLIIEDDGIRFQINKAAGGQVDSIYNKKHRIQYLRGNGYYYLAGTGEDSFAGNFYQSFDARSDLAILEDGTNRVIVEVAGSLKRPDGTSLGVAYLRRYTYSRGTNTIAVSHTIRFDKQVTLRHLSTTLDCDADVGCKNMQWGPTEYYVGAGNTWNRKTADGAMHTSAIDSAGLSFPNVGRMFIPGRGRLNGNSGALLTNNGKGGLRRSFDQVNPFQSIVFWTNIASVRARSLEAHFLNRDSTYVTRRDGGPFTIAKGTLYRATEALTMLN